MNRAMIASSQVATMATRRRTRRRVLIFARRRFFAALRLRRRSGHALNRSLIVMDSLRVTRLGPPFCSFSGRTPGLRGTSRSGTSAVRRVQGRSGWLPEHERPDQVVPPAVETYLDDVNVKLGAVA